MNIFMITSDRLAAERLDDERFDEERFDESPLSFLDLGDETGDADLWSSSNFIKFNRFSTALFFLFSLRDIGRSSVGGFGGFVPVFETAVEFICIICR